MLASNLGLMFQVSTVDFPPAQKFEFFSRVNRQTKAEVVPLAVVDFTSQVKNPSDDVLQKFFDKYKDRFPDATSPDPGFKEPPRAAFQYFKADFAKLTEAMKPKVTDEEISDYYEKNKAQFLALELPEEPADEMPAEEEAKPAEEPAKDPEDKSSEEKAGDEKPSEEKAGDEKSDEPAEEPKPDEPKPAEEPESDEAPPTEATEGDSPGTDEKPAEDSSPEPEQSFQQSRRTLQLVSLKAQAEEEPATSDTAAAGAAEPADEAKPADDKPAAAAPAEDKPADAPTDKPADEPPAEENAPATEAEKPADAKTPAAEAEPAAEPPAETRYEPLEKVSDQIRDTLASQKAAERIEEIFDELQSEMRRHAEQVDIYVTRDKSDSSIEPPKPFPFAELAKKYDIDAAEVPPVTAIDIAAEELGKVARIVRDRNSQFGFRRETLPEFAFSESFPTYKAAIVQDAEGNGFLLWKTEEQEAYVPQFDQVHDKVLAAWKMIEARPLARKRAEELAKQAAAAGKPLSEVFADQSGLKVIDTGSFSWLTRGNVPENPMGGPLRISTIEGLEQLGNSFMETVFSLDAGATGVATNEPKDTVYVVRPSEFVPELDQLRDQFAKERPGMYMTVAQNDRYNMYTTWVDNLEKEAEIRWVREPDQARRRTSDADDL